MKKLRQSKLFYPLLTTILDFVFWILYIVFTVQFNNSIDWVEYNKQVELGNEVDITLFYNEFSLFYEFIGFLFLALGIAFSIMLMVAWTKLAFVRINEKYGK